MPLLPDHSYTFQKFDSTCNVFFLLWLSDISCVRAISQRFRLQINIILSRRWESLLSNCNQSVSACNRLNTPNLNKNWMCFSCEFLLIKVFIKFSSNTVYNFCTAILFFWNKRLQLDFYRTKSKWIFLHKSILLWNSRLHGVLPCICTLRFHECNTGTAIFKETVRIYVRTY